MLASNSQQGSPIQRRNSILAEEGPVVAFHMKAWKHPFLQQFFPQKRFHFMPFQLSEKQFRRKVLPLLQGRQKPVIFVWSNNLPDFAAQEIHRLGLSVYFMEDGFIRSLEAHAGYSVPLSLSLDSQRPYFDSRGPSDLEELLSTYDFAGDAPLMARARHGMQQILQQRLTKYNGKLDRPAAVLEREGEARRTILVIGQVEEDASIRYGCDRPFTNNDLVRLAAAENQDAHVIYKPHPDVLSRMRREVSNPDDVAHLCTIVKGQLSLPDALDLADHVYTITSLAGFEALMRGKKVTSLGAPFYAGWGLTDDRQPTSRRGRNLSLEALFAATYLLYPAYFDPANGEASSFEKTIASLKSPHSKPRVALAGRVKWKPFGAYGVLGWRHLLTPVVSRVIATIGNERDVEQYLSNPIGFFKELPSKYRLIRGLLYPW